MRSYKYINTIKKSALSLLICVVCVPFAKAQSKKVDSLLAILKITKEDTTKFNAYLALGNQFQNSNPDTAIYFHTKAKEIASKIPGAKGELRKGEALRQTAVDFYAKSDFAKALKFYEEALVICQKYIAENNKSVQLRAKILQAATLGNIGNIYYYQSNYAKALDYYFKALKINEEIDNKRGRVSNLGNIGIVYNDQSNYAKALDYYFKALKINETMGNKHVMANNLGNIGVVYANQSNNAKALDYYFKALKINEEIGSKRNQATILGNIGNVYKEQSNYAKASDYYFKALKINEDIGNKREQTVNLGNIGSLYLKQRKYAYAEKFLKQAEHKNRELGTIYFLKDNCEYLSDLYTETNRHKEAMYYYKEHIKYRDSVLSEENQKAAIVKEMQFGYEKKAAADSVANAKQIEIKNVELAKQNAEIKVKKQQQYALFGGLFLVAVFALVMVNRFRVTNKQKKLIEKQKKIVEEQKQLVEEHQKEILDSIHYAKRIQVALLPTEKYIERILKAILFVLLYFSPLLWRGAGGEVQAQTKKIDSLLQVLKTATKDTTKFNAYLVLGNQFQNTNPDTAIYFHTKAKEIASKIPGAEGELRKGEAIRKAGWNCYTKSDFAGALKFYEEALGISQRYISGKSKSIQLRAKKLQAASLGNIGSVYKEQSNYAKALDYYFKSLKISEEMGNKKSQAANLGNIGIVYHTQSNYAKALNYYFKALKINEDIGNKKDQAANLSNIGNVYNEQSNYAKALNYYFKALKINEDIGNKSGQAANLGNIGSIYSDQYNYAKALDYYLKAMKINEEIGNKSGQAINLGNIGVSYFKQKKYALAEKFLKQAEQMNRELGTIYSLQYNCNYLSELYSQTGRHKEALYYYKEHIKYRDSVLSEENQKAAIVKEMQFGYEKKAAADSVANAKQIEIKNVELAKQHAEIKVKKQQQYALFGGLFLVAVFALVMVNRFRVTNKQKKLIEKQKRIVEDQKQLVEEKQKEILDSIHYAKRIQTALLTSEKYITRKLNALQN